MGHVHHYSCDACGAVIEPRDASYTCPACGPRWGTLHVHYDLDALRSRMSRETLRENRDPSIWRYADLLPVGAGAAALARGPRVGGTPLYDAPRLASEAGIAHLWIKDDAMNPSASLKDRASSVCVARARELGAQTITVASTGNAAASLSLFAAFARIPVTIFVPAHTSEAKLTQMAVFGARVVKVAGTYDQCVSLSLEATRTLGWFNRTSGFNPVLAEGKKTVALEICEQLSFDVPDWVAVPVGDGCILSGVWKGFCDFHALGLIDRKPRLLGVQAENAAPLFAAWSRGDARPSPTGSDTIADGIAVGDPRDALPALRAVRDSDGAFVTVSDAEILAAMRDLARGAAVFAESAAAASFAGVRRFARAGGLGAQDRVAAILTGSGLKDIKNATAAASDAVMPVVPPDFAEARRALGVR
jgi:threonine synthase